MAGIFVKGMVLMNNKGIATILLLLSFVLAGRRAPSIQSTEVRLKNASQTVDLVEFILNFPKKLELNMSTKYRVSP